MAEIKKKLLVPYIPVIKLATLFIHFFFPAKSVDYMHYDMLYTYDQKNEEIVFFDKKARKRTRFKVPFAL